MARHVHAEGIRSAQSRALWAALLANAVFAVVEVAGGVAFRSLALLSDAAHMFVDVGALGIALLAHRLASAPASGRHTYGLQRAEVLAALGNGVLAAALALLIAAEAAGRLADPSDVHGAGVLWVATAGLAVNVGSATLIARAAGRSLNMRGAFVHMLGDAGGSVAVIVAGVAVTLAAANWVDAVASLVIVALLLAAAWALVREALHVLMEGVPRGLHPERVAGALAEDGDVEAVHHVHIWNLASYTPALSAHVVLAGDVSLHEAQLKGDRLKRMLEERFGIDHSTLELECHPCEPDRPR